MSGTSQRIALSQLASVCGLCSDTAMVQTSDLLDQWGDQGVACTALPISETEASENGNQPLLQKLTGRKLHLHQTFHGPH